MKALVYRKGKWEQLDIASNNSLETMQKIVEGYIERIPADELTGTGISMYVNEEARLADLLPAFTTMINNVPTRILGNVVFVRDDEEDLTEKQIEEIINVFS